MASAPGGTWFRRWTALAVALCGLSLFVARVARADATDLATDVKGLCLPAGDDVAKAATAIASCGDPRALPILVGLRDDALVVTDSGHAYLRDSSGALRDAVTGGPPAGEPTRAPTSDNEVRRALEPLIARLQLQSPVTKERLDAVGVLESRSSEEDAPFLRDTLAKETDGAVRRAITAALAELDLASDDPARRIGAVAAIEATGSLRFKSTLEGLSSDPDPKLRDAAAHALSVLNRKQFFVDHIADVIYGLSTGSILLLTALGLAITFGLMRVINMAHGEMLMLGAYATFVTQTFFHAHFPAHESLYLVAAIPVALLTTMAVGALLERCVVRFLYGRPLETLLATYGLSLLLIQTVRSVFGAQNVTVENPPWLAGGVELFEDVVIPYNRIAVVLFTILVVSFVAYVLRGTSLGLLVRAVTQNRPMAACMGISTRRVDTWTFALGSGVGGLAGVALSQLGNVGPELGQGYIVDSFLVVVLGGVGKLVGCVFAAFSLGILNKVLEPIAGAVLGKIVVLMLVVLIIQRRPQGLFAPRGRGAEGT
ncbi:MAG TPA: urea ABC transporter permease subunit UrtB [Polyangiaceae bacterium]|jgi:urea transport system permease protein